MYLRILFIAIIDINECEGVNDCQQLCENTVGSYSCSCNEGFTLAEDGRNCTGKSTTYNTSLLASSLDLPAFNVAHKKQSREGLGTRLLVYA